MSTELVSSAQQYNQFMYTDNYNLKNLFILYFIAN